MSPFRTSTITVPGINEARYETHIHLVPSAEPPVGVSEPGIDAIFAATGRRSRERTVEKTSSTRRRR